MSISILNLLLLLCANKFITLLGPASEKKEKWANVPNI